MMRALLSYFKDKKVFKKGVIMQTQNRSLNFSGQTFYSGPVLVFDPSVAGQARLDAGQAGSMPMIILSDINCLLSCKYFAQGRHFCGNFLVIKIPFFFNWVKKEFA